MLQFALWALFAVPPAPARPLPWPVPSTWSAPAGQTQTTRNPHGAVTIPCENCHTSTGWRPIRAVPEFDHNKTKYPLRGLHEKVKCVQCHIQPVFTNVSKNCADCHADIHRRQMGSDCAQCHTVKGWTIAPQQVQDHQNRFPLLGAHAAVPCDSCHKSAAVGQFLGLETQCDSCHLKDWQNTTNPPHQSAGPAFASSKCDQCHGFDSWLGAKFDHSSTGFLLTNGHGNLACSACHINNNYNLTSGACQNCHLTQWQQTNNPPHASAGPAFAAANCATCHNTITWTTATFDHSTTGFLLTNGHANVPCASCHSNNNYNLTSGACQNCHLTQWQQTNNPPHASAGPAFAAANCATCHNTITWTTATFDHSTTGFLLTNGHANVPCASCHINNNYNLQIAPTDCGNSGCHLTTWQQTNNPTHSTAGSAFAASNCASCHTTQGWSSASFDHSTTGFALVGTHMSPSPTPCLACHVNNNYTLNSADCLSCHQSAWNSTQTLGGSVPNHVAANFPTTASACATCHTITSWSNGVFDHSSTGFPLTNSHQLAPAGKVTTCIQCHIGGNYSLQISPTDCGNSGCHLTTWQQTNNPTHSTAGSAFATSNCSTCHNTITWTTATFDHNTTGFPLTGAHTTTACALCHINNNYNLTTSNTDCYGCHQSNWNNTTTLGGNVPNHIAAGFPTSLCSTCHNTVAWNPGMFNHATTGWALTGTHTTTPCSACHINNNYSLTAANTACYGCHQADWNSTQTLGGSVPNHIAAGYPTTCDTCHTTTNWLGATFNHTYFPIPHHGSVCNDCHQVATNYASFTCINCHTQTAHQQTQTNQIHADIPGYSYGPTTCYNCHKTGGGG